jgi:hypothetical protein
LPLLLLWAATECGAHLGLGLNLTAHAMLNKNDNNGLAIGSNSLVNTTVNTQSNTQSFGSNQDS